MLITHSPRIIYALVITINPSIEAFNIYFQQQPIYDWTLQKLDKMTRLSNPPERHKQPRTHIHNSVTHITIKSSL